MKAVVVNRVGAADGLELAEVPDPICGAGQVSIAVEAAGVGLVDVLQRQGFLGAVAPGHILGLEVAGRVRSVGAGVDASLIGKRVYARGAGGYAERFVASAGEIVALPDAVSSASAVALGINALVARFSLIRASCGEGQRVLIRGASGGIGALAAQMAVRLGAEVTAITNETAAERVLSLGVRQVLRRGTDPHPEGPYDVIIDPVAGAQMPEFIALLAPNGRYVVNGAAAGLPPDGVGSSLLQIFARSPTYSMFSLDSVPSAEAVTVAASLFAEAAQGELEAVIAREFSFEEVVEAHKFLETGAGFGKVVLRP